MGDIGMFQMNCFKGVNVKAICTRSFEKTSETMEEFLHETSCRMRCLHHDE